MDLSTIEQALTALREGRPVLVADAEGRENEGDVILAAQFATTEWLAWIVNNSSGYICAPMTQALANKLELPLMTVANQDSLRTQYTISVDAAEGVSTGISASDRAHTLRTLANPVSTSHDLIRPGHILPLRAVNGGVRERGGHTEATVDLLRLAGLEPVGVIAEILDDDGDMMRMPGLVDLASRESLAVTTVAAIVEYLEAHPDEAVAPTNLDRNRVEFVVETEVPTEFGLLTMRGYRDHTTGTDHVAIVSGTPAAHGTIVRVHSECLTGEALGSLKCECGPQLDEALRMIVREGGVVLYMRGHEGRGIGLVNKFKAYKLQESGLDTLDANLALGFPADARDYVAAARMLDDLGIESVRLMSNNPEKGRQLEKYGIDIEGYEPLVVGLGAFNTGYLDVKRDRMGHRLPGDLAQIESVADATVPSA